MEREKGSPKNRIAIIMLFAAGLLLLLLISAVSLGWFTNNKTVEGSEMGMTAADGIYELAALDKGGLYDRILSVPDGKSRNDVTLSDGTAITLSATADGKPEIKWQMSDESNFGNLAGEGIQPGSCGRLTFYVIARKDADLDLTFTLDTVLYNNSAAENRDNSDCIIPQNEAVSKLAKGHILFFGKYDEESGIYSERITDGFTFSQKNAKENTAYRVDFYWVWPSFADQLILPSGDGILRKRGYERLTANTEAVISEGEAEAFFEGGAENLAAMLENMAAGSDSPSFNEEYYNTLNAKWNSADQLIGTSAAFIELKLTADLIK